MRDSKRNVRPVLRFPLSSRCHRIVGTEWQIVSVVHFNGDGQTDLVWFNTATGQAAAWYMRFWHSRLT